MKRSIFLVLLCGGAVAAQAQSTAFTYQGRLNENGSPANGLYDLKFTLFDSVTNGDAAGPLTNSAVAVSNGVFTVLLDFGALNFNGDPRWLEVAVRPAGGGAFSTLNPRQPIIPTPYAVFAANARSALSVATGAAVRSLNGRTDAVTLAAGQNVTITPSGNTLTIGASGINPWQLVSSNAFYNAGNVGIGTSFPDRPLAIEGLGPADEWISFVRGGIARWHLNNRNSGLNLAETGAADGRLFVAQGGNVGLGTETPLAKLDVRGDIRLGSSGQLRAASGEENLRIVSGGVSSTGTGSGTGFTAQRIENAKYLVTFATPFVGRPFVVATAHRSPFGVADQAFWAVATDGVTPSSVTFVVRNVSGGGEWQDHTFDFIAIGPR